ncbi:MAG: hypothetical protein CR972_04680 [Candidatus Moraniibacteriota bacterium]|nr:MAG: hypothetical protein CR972_04680 [Candidatus Moranbacteria bacterium]
MKNFVKKLPLLLVLLLFAAPAIAGPIDVGDKVKLNPWAGDYPYTLTINGYTYDAFCIEVKAKLAGYDYYVESIGDVAYAGGPGDSDYYNTSHNVAGVPFGDPLSDATRWIYAAYQENVFNGIDTGNISLGKYVQNALWYAEEEPGGNKSYFDNLLAFGGYNSNSWVEMKQKGWVVKALNLTTTAPGLNGQYIGCAADNQSQLIGFQVQSPPSEVPEPTTLALLGFGLLGVAGVSRKKLKK